jgi:hypothetical protein
LVSSRAEEFAVEHEGPVYAVAFSRDGTLLATVGGDSGYVSARSATRMGTGSASSRCLSLALAGDAEHWLADEPVEAWHEPWPDRAGRWVKRHRTLTTVAAARGLEKVGHA